MEDTLQLIEKNIENLTSGSITPTTKKFKLKKEKSRQITILSKPIIIVDKIAKEDCKKIKQDTLGIELIRFRKKLYKKFKSDNLKLLNFNIKTLKIKIKYIAPEILLLKFASGKYYIKRNEIKVLNSLKKESLSHELLHMASSIYDPRYNIAFCGFQQINFNKKKTVGKGLNEGYTDLLNKRYFNDRTKYSSYAYDLCMFFSEKLEQIVEKNKMEQFYLNADLFGLFKYLNNFDVGENIVSFFVILDILVDNISFSKIKKYEKACELIECYLAKWYINKKKLELDKYIIDKDTFDKQIKDYIDSLEDKDLYIENYIKQKEYCLK